MKKKISREEIEQVWSSLSNSARLLAEIAHGTLLEDVRKAESILGWLIYGAEVTGKPKE